MVDDARVGVADKASLAESELAKGGSNSRADSI